MTAPATCSAASPPRLVRAANDQLGRCIGRHRKEGRLRLERHLQQLGPARQFGQAVSLALRRALGQRQAAGHAEHLGQVEWLELDVGAGRLGHVDEALVAEVGPGRIRGQVILDGLAHRSSVRKV
jgi:hypothetical protein